MARQRDPRRGLSHPRPKRFDADSLAPLIGHILLPHGCRIDAYMHGVALQPWSSGGGGGPSAAVSHTEWETLAEAAVNAAESGDWTVAAQLLDWLAENDIGGEEFRAARLLISEQEFGGHATDPPANKAALAAGRAADAAAAVPQVIMRDRLVSSIVVGERCRKDVGDLDSLIASIRDVGFLHPIVVNSRSELIVGFRRFQAAIRMGLRTVPTRMCSNLDDAIAAVKAERDENTCRKEFTPSEMVSIGRRLEAMERPAAAERQQATRAKNGENAGKKRGGKLPPPSRAAAGKTRDKVAAVIGVSGRTYEKAKEVVEAAEKEPEKFAPVVEEMDRTGKVEPAYQKVVASPGPPRQPTPLDKLLAAWRKATPEQRVEFMAAVGLEYAPKKK